jgi:acyl dehydratase
MRNKTFWEDLEEGQKLRCKKIKIEKAELTRFAKKYDPQPFHVDEEAGRKSVFGGLIASALHTLSACTRAVVEAQGNAAIISGLGLDEAKMYNPVRPGDVLSIEATWVDLKRSRSKLNRGFAGIKCRVTNQKGEPITEYGYRYLIECRTKG